MTTDFHRLNWILEHGLDVLSPAREGDPWAVHDTIRRRFFYGATPHDAIEQSMTHWDMSSTQGAFSGDNQTGKGGAK
jgi:hypothetical protein